MKALFLAGGMGTRLREMTKQLPKPMIPIFSKPLLARNIARLKEFGVDEVVLSTCYMPDKIRDYFGDGSGLGIKIDYVHEETPLGTGGAIRNAAAKFDDTFLVFNGDIGFVMAIEPGRMTVHFGDELEVDYESGEFGELSLAYALTVHKSQGSEYPVVILPLVRSHTIMMQRNLLYTAVTRAKREVILLGSKAALNTAVANNRTSKRYTLLAERLHYGFER